MAGFKSGGVAINALGVCKMFAFLIRKWRVLNGKHDESFTGNNSEQIELC